ncbi:helicase associated domain-containing protein [Nocardioides marmoraquaticus]
MRHFAARAGHARVPTGHLKAADTATPTGDEAPLRLGQWVIAQRPQHKTDDLPAERIKQLVDVPGWVWHVRVYAWEGGPEALRDFVKPTATRRQLLLMSTTVTSSVRGG